jgi:hypothetical protein
MILSGFYTDGGCHAVDDLLGALPTWPYSADWGYYASSGLALVLVVLILVMFAGPGRRI